MSRLTLQERMRVTAIGAEKARRGLLARALGPPTLRWRYGASRADQLLIVPQDLRQADPSFWLEMCHEQFGLAGSIARLNGLSPFEIRPPSRKWNLSLHGFSWLRHLAAADSDEARRAGQQLALQWIKREKNHTEGDGWRPEVLARRIIAWLSHSGLLFDGVDDRTYNTISCSLGAQLQKLSSARREAPSGQPRLLALIALVLADLCIAGRERRLRSDLPLLLAELDRQILPDGGHVSRNTCVLVELLLDLLPLRQCFRARGRQQPVQLDEAISAMLGMLRYMRLGDGLLARFNGVSVGLPARLATVLVYADAEAPALVRAIGSAYQRVECGDTILVVDCGTAPAAELAEHAHAGCLSFEVSSGTQVLFSNSGAPGPAHADWEPTARATASHNTLVVGEMSSARLIGNRRVEELLGGLPIDGPTVSGIELVRLDDRVVGIAAAHDGYNARHGLLHHRRIVMENDGRRIVGTDVLRPPRGVLRLKKDIPFSIHFHLHPGVTCSLGELVGTAVVETAGQRWRVTVEGARLGIEESIYFADAAGPLERLQIVLRGATFGETEVRWALARLD